MLILQKTVGSSMYFGGFFLSENTILIGTFRYQSFDTEVEDIIETFKGENPGAEFTGSTEDWQTYYFPVGLAYRIDIGFRFNLGPVVGLGPVFAMNPGINSFFDLVPGSSEEY